MAGILIKMACMVVACMVVLAPHAEAITCGQVTGYLLPCLPYLRSGGAMGGCCSGVRALNGAAQTTADRKTACGCIKSASAAFPGINGASASGLPTKCGVKIPYKISPSTDCSKIK